MTDTRTPNFKEEHLHYKELRTKLIVTLFILSTIITISVEFYHYKVREKILYDTSVEKLLILTKTIRNIEKGQLRLYDARFHKVQSHSQLFKAIEKRDQKSIQKIGEPIFTYFQNSSLSLVNIKIYDSQAEQLFLLNQNYLSKNNIVLKQVLKTGKKAKGYVVTNDGLFYNSLIYPLVKNKKTVGYIEFVLKADNLYRLSTKAGRYKYALYLNNTNQNSTHRSIGKLVATNSKMFKNLQLNQEFIYKYANQNKIIKYNDKYYILQQYDIETPFQKNFAQVILASNTTLFVQNNKNITLHSIELSIIMLFILLFLIYFVLTKLIDKLTQEEKELQKNQMQMQIIMDNSDSLIALFDHGKLVLVNKPFLSYTKLDTIHEVIQAQCNLSSLFLKEKNTFSSPKSLLNIEWIEMMNELEDENKIVALNHKKYGRNYFNVKITQHQNSDNSYIVIFSDISSIYKKSQKDEYMAYHDTLTDIYNREYFNETIKDTLYKALKHRQPSTLLMLDLDFFKKVNDTYGHQVGDEVLIRFSQIISQNIRENDIFARWGGEEFVVLLNNTSKKAAVKVADHLREKIQNTSFDQVGHITCSIGLSEYIDGDRVDTWVARVDKALYKAKLNGRNRVEIE